MEQAIQLNFRDFEDAVQYVCGVVQGVDVIVTRDASGFVNSQIPVTLLEAIDSIDIDIKAKLCSCPFLHPERFQDEGLNFSMAIGIAFYCKLLKNSSSIKYSQFSSG